MLILSRKVDESVIIVVPPCSTETRITVQLVGVPSLVKARLGFQAPSHVLVNRDEIQHIIDREASDKVNDEE